MALSVHLTRRALHEIDEALEWLSERSPEAALRWHEQLQEAIRSLENNPERCGLAPESEWYPGELRQLLHGKRRGVYRILFEVRNDTVYILRVRHSAQALLQVQTGATTTSQTGRVFLGGCNRPGVGLRSTHHPTSCKSALPFP